VKTDGKRSAGKIVSFTMFLPLPLVSVGATCCSLLSGGFFVSCGHLGRFRRSATVVLDWPVARLL